jgi:hypothetical protein
LQEERADKENELFVVNSEKKLKSIFLRTKMNVANLDRINEWEKVITDDMNEDEKKKVLETNARR